MIQSGIVIRQNRPHITDLWRRKRWLQTERADFVNEKWPENLTWIWLEGQAGQETQRNNNYGNSRSAIHHLSIQDRLGIVCSPVMFCRGNAVSSDINQAWGNAVPPDKNQTSGNAVHHRTIFFFDCTRLTAKLVQPKNIYLLTMKVMLFWKLSTFRSRKYLRP